MCSIIAVPGDTGPAAGETRPEPSDRLNGAAPGTPPDALWLRRAVGTTSVETHSWALCQSSGWLRAAFDRGLSEPCFFPT